MDEEKFLYFKNVALGDYDSGNYRLSKIGNWLEKQAKKYQIRRIEKNPLTVATGPGAGGHQSGHIVYSDEMLAFHPDSPEKEIIEKYIKNLNLLK